jgi:hypothetical protein
MISRQVRRGSGHAVRLVGVLDLLAADPQQVQDRIQIGHVDGGVGLLAHDRLGVERDSETGGGQHVEVVSTVPDRHRAGQGQVLRGRKTAQCLGLAPTVDDLADEAAGEETILDLKAVGVGMVDPQLIRQRADHLDEPPGDDCHGEPEALQCPHQCPRAGGQPNLGTHLVEDAFRKPGEQAHPATQALCEVEIATHGRRGQLGHLGLLAGVPG